MYASRFGVFAVRMSRSNENMDESNEKRVKVSKTHKRKLFFEKFLFDWKNEVEDRNFGAILWKAYSGMKRYPLELNSGEEAKLLKGVGPLIADRLDSAWTMFVDDLGREPNITDVKNLKRGATVRFNSTAKKGSKQQSSSSSSGAATSPKTKKTAQAKQQRRKSPTASLASSAISSISSMDSSSDCHVASTSASQPTTTRSPQRPPSSLTRVRSDPSIPSIPSASTDSTDSTDSPSQSTYTPFEVVDFDVVFLVDNQEKHASKSVTDWLTKIKCSYEMRQLVVGDYAWVARCRTTGRELLLDCIVERKRWDDFAHSIKENRYHEQKARLNDSGVDKRILLVERQTRQLHGRINDQTLYQAMANTQVHDGFEVHVTSGAEESARYLGKLTGRLTRGVAGRRLLSSSRCQFSEDRQTPPSGVSLLTFAEFSLASKKTKPLTVRDLLVRQLTVCPGVTADRATAIAGQFPTFALLTAAFVGCKTEEERESLLENSNCQPKVERTQSRHLARFFSAAC